MIHVENGVWRPLQLRYSSLQRAGHETGLALRGNQNRMKFGQMAGKMRRAEAGQIENILRPRDDGKVDLASLQLILHCGEAARIFGRIEGPTGHGKIILNEPVWRQHNGSHGAGETFFVGRPRVRLRPRPKIWSAGSGK